MGVDLVVDLRSATTQSVMATIAIALKTKQKLSNNEYAVALRVTHERVSRFYAIRSLVTNQSLKLRCKVADWKPAEFEDNGLGKFRKTFKTFKECNTILEAKLIEACWWCLG